MGVEPLPPGGSELDATPKTDRIRSRNLLHLERSAIRRSPWDEELLSAACRCGRNAKIPRGYTTTFTTAGFGAAVGARNAASSAASRVFAVLRCASFTWPYPRMCSG